MSAGNVITQIRRKQGRFDFIPVYSTAQLLQGVCHVAHVQHPEEETSKRMARAMTALGTAQECGRRARSMRSRLKFETNKEEIYMLLAQGRGVKGVADQFSIGYGALTRYLKDEESK